MIITPTSMIKCNIDNNLITCIYIYKVVGSFNNMHKKIRSREMWSWSIVCTPAAKGK